MSSPEPSQRAGGDTVPAAPEPAGAQSSAPAPEPSSPALRRLLFSVGAWITAATLTALGNIGISASGRHPVVAWLLAQLAPGILVVLGLGLLFSFVSAAVRLRGYRRREATRGIDLVGPPPPVLPDRTSDARDDERVRALLDDPARGIDPCRVYRVDVRGVRSSTPWADAADRILFAFDRPGITWRAGDSEATVRRETALRCADALEPRALLVLDHEEDLPERVDWLDDAFADVTGPASAGPGPLLYRIAHADPDTAHGPPLDPESDEYLLLQVLARLPIDELDTDGLAALNNELAVFMENAERTVTYDRRYSPTAIAGVQERTRVSDDPTGRFRIFPALRELLLSAWEAQRPSASARAEAARRAVDAAVPWTLRHYATLCEAWGRELGAPQRATVAARWFRTKEPLLRTLVTGTFGPFPGADPDTDRRQGERLLLAIDDLARIADSLDLWYRREHQAWLAIEVATALADKADRIGHSALGALAEVRRAAAERALADTGGAARMVGRPPSLARRDHPRRFRSALRSRLAHDEAMYALGRGDVDDRRLREVERQLREAWLRLPRKDLRGAVTILINLSIVHLKQGRPQPARDRLELAESLAATARDAGARAQAIELQGVVAWSAGHGSRAMRRWEDARRLYCSLGERYGEGRCCQHLGSAALRSHAMAAVLVETSTDADPDTNGPVANSMGVTRDQARRFAYRMLQRAERQLGAEAELVVGELAELPGELSESEAGVADTISATLLAGPTSTAGAVNRPAAVNRPGAAGDPAPSETPDGHEPAAVERIRRWLRRLLGPPRRP